MNWREALGMLLVIVATFAAAAIALFLAIVIVSYFTGTPLPW